MLRLGSILNAFEIKVLTFWISEGSMGQIVYFNEKIDLCKYGLN